MFWHWQHLKSPTQVIHNTICINMNEYTNMFVYQWIYRMIRDAIVYLYSKYKLTFFFFIIYIHGCIHENNEDLNEWQVISYQLKFSQSQFNNFYTYTYVLLYYFGAVFEQILIKRYGRTRHMFIERKIHKKWQLEIAISRGFDHSVEHICTYIEHK